MAQTSDRSGTAGGSWIDSDLCHGCPHASIPFWPLLFKNVRVDFLSSDDFAPANKANAAEAVNEALAAGWGGFEIAERFPLEQIATAHERVEAPRRRGRIVLVV